MIRLTLIGKVSKFSLREGGPDKGRTEVTVKNLEVPSLGFDAYCDCELTAQI